MAVYRLRGKGRSGDRKYHRGPDRIERSADQPGKSTTAGAGHGGPRIYMGYLSPHEVLDIRLVYTVCCYEKLII